MKLNIGDIIDIDGRLFEIVLIPKSNGTHKFLCPGLKIFKIESGIRRGLTPTQKDIIIETIRNIKLNKTDLPVNEKEIKPKDIFKK